MNPPAVRRPQLRLLRAHAARCRRLRGGPAQSAARAAPLYKNPDAPIPAARRRPDGRMTLEEKVAQIRTPWAAKADMIDGLRLQPGQGQRRLSRRHRPGHPPSDRRGVAAASARRAARRRAGARRPRRCAFINAVQRWAMDETRLGIPVLLHEESLHGYMATEATMFPQAIALAGSFDPRAASRRQSRDRPRDARARRATGAVAGGRHRPRSALGPDRGDLRRRSLPRAARWAWRPCDGLQGAGECGWRPARCSPR